MRAKFFGKDPDSQVDNSPTLFVTDRTDRRTLCSCLPRPRGRTLTDLIKPGPAIRQLFYEFRYTAFRLEARDRYDAPYENDSLAKFLDQRTKLFRVFESTVIPGLLQTAEYARIRFAEGIRVFKLTNDINEAIQGRIQRQEILYRPDKRFHFVLTEAALRIRLCPPEVMLGVIDFRTRYATSPWHGFWMYDTDRVLVETYSAALPVTGRGSVRWRCRSVGFTAARHRHRKS